MKKNHVWVVEQYDARLGKGDWYPLINYVRRQKWFALQDKAGLQGACRGEKFRLRKYVSE